MPKITLVGSYQEQFMDRREVTLLIEKAAGDNDAAVKAALEAEYGNVWPMSMATTPTLETWMAGSDGTWTKTEA